MTSNRIFEAAREMADTRKRAKSDGFYLGTEILGYDFQEDVHRELFEYTIDPSKSLYEQEFPKDELILWPRGHFKTTARVVQIIQLILNFPDIRLMIMQGTVELTKGWLSEIKSHFTGDNQNSRLREYFPEFCADRLGTKMKFTVPCRQRRHLKEPTIMIASSKSVKASQHYDGGFFDDLVNEQNYRNPAMVQKVTEDFNNCTPLIDPGGFKRVSGTRYTFGDLYEQIIRRNQGEWKISIKDCWQPGTDGVPLFEQRTLENGRKIGFTRAMLEQIEREDPEMYSAQYLNKPISASRHLFPETEMRKHLRENKNLGLSQAIMFIDLGSSQRSRSDFSVVIAGAVNAYGDMYVIDEAGDRYTVVSLGQAIIDMALRLRPLAIMIEGTAAAKYLIEYLNVLCRDKQIVLPLQEIPVDNTPDAKFLRISAIKQYLHRLFFVAGLTHWELIVQQFDQFGGRGMSGHDDYPDTISLMVQHFTKHVPEKRPDPFSYLAPIPIPSDSIMAPLPDNGGNDGPSLGGDFLC